MVEVNDVPVADAGGPYSGSAGQGITLDGSGSSDFDNEDDTAANDQTLSYTWYFGDGSTDTTTSATVTHTYAVVGTYTATLTATNPDNGSLEWTYEFDGTNMAQPIWDADENTLFVSALRVGTRALKMTRQDGKIVLQEVWKTRKVQFYHVNPIAVGDYVYGSSGGGPCFLAAINRKTGKVAWRKRGFAMATAVMADGKFIILDEDGQLAIIRATPDSFEVLSQVSLLDEVAWTVPTVVGKKLYLRDKKTIRALDLS